MSSAESEPIRSFAETGPAFQALLEQGAVDWDAWRRAARRLETELPDLPGRDRRIHHLYVPILLCLSGAIRRSSQRPIVAGLSAPQGAGKTTLVRYLAPLLSDLGWRTVAISIDDFYLTHDEQKRLAAVHPRNPYLQYRGYPGTHDVPLGLRTLEELRTLRSGKSARVPGYDKSLHAGRGDRLPPDRWREVTGPLDLVLLEGWMLGFQPVAAASVVDPEMRVVNEQLQAYEAWHRLIDLMVILRSSDVEQIIRWRVEAEEAMRREGRPGLDAAAAEDYARRFAPAYRLYADTVAAGRWRGGRRITFELAGDRLPETRRS
jgi:D-glycerate 3-kinase